MSKIIYKTIVAVLLAAALLVLRFTQGAANSQTLSANDCLMKHPDLSKRGSITIHIRQLEGVELPPGTSLADDQGVRVPNVPIQIERRELNTPSPDFKITQAQMRNIDWILENTTAVADGVAAVAGARYQARTNADGIITFNDLPQGIWLVSHMDSLDGVDNPIPSEVNGEPNPDRFIPFLVGIPTLTDDGCYILDFVIWPKISHELVTGVDKKITSNIDNILTWTIGTNIPFRIGTAANFTITDTLDERITLRPGSTPIVRFTSRTAPHNFVNLDPVTDFTFTNPAPTATVGEQVIIDLTTTGMSRISTNGLLGKGRIEVEFDTVFKINFNDVNAKLLEMLYNDAVINYNGSEYKVYNSTPLLALNILKLNRADRQPLAGATFRLYREATDEDPVENRIQIPARFNPDGAEKVNVVALRTSANMPMQATTNEDGILQFNHINSANAKNGRFWISEVTPPTGFRANNPWILIAVTPSHTTVRKAAPDFEITSNASSNIVHINIDNERGGAWRLPETGTTVILLTGAGIILIGSALVLSAQKKKKAKLKS